VNASLAGKEITLRGRIQTTRPVGAKKGFFVIRQRFNTVQAILSVDADQISKQMLKWALSVPSESLVVITAKVTVPPDPIKSCTVQDAELVIATIHTETEATPRLPFSIEAATLSEAEIEASQATDIPFAGVLLETRLDNRVVDLRTITNQAIFRIQAGVIRLFRNFLDSANFTEIHTPKIIGAASEGGANVFKVKYFDTSAYLAQSPQLYKQMCICADFERVYEIAPVFRAENSNTHRHMTEFMGLDLEMQIDEHYHETMDLFDDLFTCIFKGLSTEYAKELDVIRRQYPFEDFLFLPKALRLDFSEGIQMLRAAGVEIGDYDDMSTAQERLLGKLVREKYKTDFYMLDKFPLAIRPFYTMPDPSNPGYSNSYDFFIRGEEILSGAQRIHDPELLESRAKDHGIDVASIQPYIDAFKYGAPPHAGGGIGLERVVMLYLNLGNIRRSSLFPRDPKFVLVVD
jgi:nondiscriminating aspartyl-tRNA synthetase